MKLARPDDDSTEVESSLIVPVTEAMLEVEPWRERLDPFSARGMPTHVTVEYPFLPPSRLSADVLTTLEGIFSTVAAFDFELTSVQWFDERVVWLAPECRFQLFIRCIADEVLLAAGMLSNGTGQVPHGDA